MNRILHTGKALRHFWISLALTLALLEARNANSQSFTNLDFESANLSGYSSGLVPAADAIPGWTAYLGGTVMSDIYFDVTPRVSLGVYIQDGATGHPPIQGGYDLYIIGTSLIDKVAAIGQTGTIPLTAQSMTLSANIGVLGGQIFFDGQELTLKSLGNGVYGTDVSAFAGQSGELLFTARSGGGAGFFMDKIQFSEQPIPEPSTIGLLALGGLLLGWRRYGVRQ